MTLIRQRIVIFIAIVLVGLIYQWALPAWTSAQGVAGASLLYAASPGAAVFWAVALTVVTAVIAAVAAAQARVLHAAVVLGIGLLFPAVRGGTIDEWLRVAGDSSAFWLLAIESLVWAAVLGGAMVVAAYVAQFFRRRFAAMLNLPHEPAQSPEAVDAEHPHGAMTLSQTLGAGAITIVVGSVLAMILVRTSDSGQVIAGLALAFGIAAGIGWQSFPAAHPLALLICPLLAGAGWYAWAAITGGQSAAMLHDYFGGSFTHAALALPIHYASAGVAGVAMGLLWAQSLAFGPPGIENQRHDAAAA